MKRSPEREQVKPGKRLKAFRKAREQTKWELMEAAHASANEHWPEYLWPDGNDDAWFHRKSAVSDLVEKQGQFSHHVATLALTDSDWETKEAVAAWLRSELKLLREAEAKPGAAPVRRGKALSRTQISDIAIELLECIGGECLVCLFQELLDVDRHRKSLSENFSQLEKGAEIEAQTQLQGRPMGVRELGPVDSHHRSQRAMAATVMMARKFLAVFS
jgi:hypothetical protein